MKKILIVDFDDSFIYNVAELCQSWSLDFEVHHHSKITSEFITSHKFKNIIWGPGPGHPEQYPKALELLKHLLKEEIFHFGICLGHQLIFKSLGYEIVSAESKKHGRSGKFKVPKWAVFAEEFWGLEIDVQYYSSLAVKKADTSDDLKLVVDNGAVLSGYSENFLSYQFHPESVGTSCPEALFRGFKEKMI